MLKGGDVNGIKVPMPIKKPCSNCRGNGYIKVDTVDKKDDIKQCWVCKSQGEVKEYVQKDVDSFIYDFYFNRVQKR